jgi:hypothetical protein
MSSVVASDGTLLPIESLPKVYTQSGAFVGTITVQYAGKTYRKTYENNGVAITSETRWQLI